MIDSNQPVVAHFGIPIKFTLGTLQYPGFTFRLAEKTESMRANTEPWITYTFEVRKDGHLSIGGDVVFNSEERATGRRFDVAGKIYVAELFCSTSGQQGGKHGAILTK